MNRRGLLLGAWSTCGTLNSIPSLEETEISYEWVQYLTSDDPDITRTFVNIEASMFMDPARTHPFSLTQVGEKLGFKSWNRARRLMKEIEAEFGVSFQLKLNVYCCPIVLGSGTKPTNFKCSQVFVELLRSRLSGTQVPLDDAFCRECSSP